MIDGELKRGDILWRMQRDWARPMRPVSARVYRRIDPMDSRVQVGVHAAIQREALWRTIEECAAECDRCNEDVRLAKIKERAEWARRQVAVCMSELERSTAALERARSVYSDAVAAAKAAGMEV